MTLSAVDTNVLARFVVNDDPAQHESAMRVLAQPVFVPLTVLLELSWLLMSRYRQPRAVVAAVLDGIVLLPSVVVADPDAVHWAIDRFRQGADLPDMVHLIAAGTSDRFVTFDRAMAADAGPGAPLAIETLP